MRLHTADDKPTSRLTRAAIVVGLTLGLLSTGAATLAASAGAQPPLNCTQDVSDPGCHGGRDGGVGDGDVGRTFITDEDIEYEARNGMIVDFNPGQWDKEFDFEVAVQEYWAQHEPDDAPCPALRCNFSFDYSDYNPTAGAYGVIFRVWE